MDNKQNSDDEISHLYQTLKKTEPSEKVNQAILTAAKTNLAEQTIINKKNKRAWWLNGRFHGAVAASVLLICLVYILPETYIEAPNTESHSVALSPNKPPATIEENDEQGIAGATQPIAQARSQTTFNELNDSDKLKTRFSNIDEIKADMIQQKSEMLIANSEGQRKKVASTEQLLSYAYIQRTTEKLRTELIAIQNTTKRSHKQIIKKATSLANKSDKENETIILIKQYKRLHQTLLENLKTIAQRYPEKIDFFDYQAVLSEQELAELLSITR